MPAVGSVLPNNGADNLSFTGRFGGTSFSCPQVAGVTALMLSVNENLTQQQVFDALIASADKVGGYTYSSGYSNELGYGKLNARNAVQRVLPSITGPRYFCPSASLSLTIPAGSTVNWSVSPANALTLTQGGATTTATRIGSYNGAATITATVSTPVAGGFTVTKSV